MCVGGYYISLLFLGFFDLFRKGCKQRRSSCKAVESEQIGKGSSAVLINEFCELNSLISLQCLKINPNISTGNCLLSFVICSYASSLQLHVFYLYIFNM